LEAADRICETIPHDHSPPISTLMTYSVLSEAQLSFESPVCYQKHMAPSDCPTLMVPQEATKAVAPIVVLDGGRRSISLLDVEDAINVMDGSGAGKSFAEHNVNVSDGKLKKALSQNFMDATDDVTTHPPDVEEDDGSPKEPEYVRKSCFILHFIHCFFMCFGCRPVIDRCRQSLCIKRTAACLCCPAFCMMQLSGKCKAFLFKCPCRTCFARCGNATKACCTKCIAGCCAPWIKCTGCLPSLPCRGRVSICVDSDLEQQADLTPTSIVPCSQQTGITIAAFDADPVKQLVMENVITVSGTPVVMAVATCDDAADDFDTEAIAEAA